MLRIQQIKLTLSESLDQLPDKIINKLHISSEDLLSWRIYRESLCSQGEGCAFYILH